MRIGVNTLFLIPGEVGGSETYLRRTLLAIADLFPDVGLTLFTNRENDPVLRTDLSSFPQVEYRLLNFNIWRVTLSLEVPKKLIYGTGLQQGF